MINLDAVARVQSRIAEIESRFGNPQNLIGADFASQMRREMEKMKKAAAVETPKKTETDSSAAQSVLSPQASQASQAVQQAIRAAEEARLGEEILPNRGGSTVTFSNGNIPSVYDNAAKQTATATGDVKKLLTDAAAKYNLDSRLVSAIAKAESNGDQSAVSPVGAVGVMQLMPDTAASLGVNPYDLRENIDGGAKYLRQMLDMFGGDMTKAIAAYNAGPNAVKDYGGVPPYGETRDYVSRVMSYYG